MTHDQLKDLFDQYLGREPSRTEYRIHLGKDFDEFILEISKCKERIRRLESRRNMPNKIAILLSGHVRALTVLKSLDVYCNKYNIDVFAFVWDNVGMKGKETNLDDACDPSSIETLINDRIPNLRKYVIANNKEFADSQDCSKVTYFNFSSPEIFIKSQLYSILQSFKLMEEYIEETGTKYDMVIKCRMDSEFTEFNPDESLFEDIKKDIIFVPNSDCKHIHPDHATSCWACDKMYYEHQLKRVHIFEHTNIICDLFAYGNIDSMREYCSLYLNYDRLCKEFEQDNRKSLSHKDIQHTIANNVMKIEDHIKSTYYLNCSYPERLLQKHLRDYMLVRSTKINMRFRR